MSERSGGRERSEQSGAGERVSGAKEQANGASGPVLSSGFLVNLAHSAFNVLSKRCLAMTVRRLVCRGKTSPTEFRHQMRSGDLLAYLFLNSIS